MPRLVRHFIVPPTKGPLFPGRGLDEALLETLTYHDAVLIKGAIFAASISINSAGDATCLVMRLVIYGSRPVSSICTGPVAIRTALIKVTFGPATPIAWSAVCMPVLDGGQVIGPAVGLAPGSRCPSKIAGVRFRLTARSTARSV